MNRKEAMEYNDSLKKELEQFALMYGLEKSVGTYIVDKYIIVLPEDARKGMIFLGEDSASYKAGNIKMDLPDWNLQRLLINQIVYLHISN